MWLINTATFDLELVPSHGPDEFGSDGPQRPPYAILSHRWREDEVSFQDMRNTSLRVTKRGWQKLEACCAQARSDRIGFAWIDTCCINKDSDAQLSEAINSMFGWYRDAKVCYLYMDDVGESHTQHFAKSEVWTRGWCLQELIAPRSVVCFDCHWSRLGDRSTLGQAISDATGIDLQVLHQTRSIDTYSVAQRLSWAATRKTSRPEDRAYSLIGVFGVSMPMIYGEGAQRAFFRLQSEIMKESDDHSIFAWSGTVVPSNCGMLARSPEAFQASSQIKSVSPRNGRSPYSITNRGVSITLQTLPWIANTYLAVLNCIHDEVDPAPTTMGTVGIFLHLLDDEDSCIRIKVGSHDLVTNVAKLPEFAIETEQDIREKASLTRFLWKHFTATSFYVSQSKLVLGSSMRFRPMLYGFRISRELFDSIDTNRGDALKVSYDCRFDENTRIVERSPGGLSDDAFITLFINKQEHRFKAMRLFMDKKFHPYCFLAENEALEEDSGYQIDESRRMRPMPPDGWPKADVEYGLSFVKRHYSATYGWNQTFTYAARPSEALPHYSFRKGLWQLRGDRLDGLAVNMHSIWHGDMLLEIKPGTTADGAEIWDVDLRKCRR